MNDCIELVAGKDDIVTQQTQIELQINN